METKPVHSPTQDDFGASNAFELRYPDLFREGHAFSFPCDARGHVDVQTLSDRGRASLEQVRAGVGRNFGSPHVVPRG